MDRFEEVRKLLIEAALRRKCWTCDAMPGGTCWSDYSDHGLQPCYPHDSRMDLAVVEVISGLLTLLDGLNRPDGHLP